MREDKRVGYLGPPGTFTHEAAKRFFGPEREMIFRGSVAGMLDLYRKRILHYCVLAVDSSITGTVTANLDEIRDLEDAFIVGEVYVAVHHNLMAKPGANLHEIDVVKGHPVAIEESKRWLQQTLPDVILNRVSSSALAASEVSRETSLKIAAIAPEMAAGIYGLQILASDIEDTFDNLTRFWVLGEENPPSTGEDKTTLISTGEDLDPVIRGLVEANIPILSIYERPSGKKMGGRLYWIDVGGHKENPSLRYFFDHHPAAKYRGSYASYNNNTSA